MNGKLSQLRSLVLDRNSFPSDLFETMALQLIDEIDHADAAAVSPHADLYERATAVLRARTVVHGQAAAKISRIRLFNDFHTLGRMWQGQLTHALQINMPNIPASVAAQLLATLKIWRMGVMKGEGWTDSCVDGMNYIVIADSCRMVEDDERAKANANRMHQTGASTTASGVRSEPDGSKGEMEDE